MGHKKHTLSLVELHHPLKLERIDSVVETGKSLEEIIGLVRMDPNYTVVYADGMKVLRECWADFKPTPGSVVVLRAVPGKGGGKIFRTLLTLAVVVAAIVAAPAVGAYVGGAIAFQLGAASVTALSSIIAVTTAVAGVAIMGVGMLAVNAIAPPAMANVALPAYNYAGSYLPSSTGLDRSSGGVALSSIARSPSITGGRNSSNKYGPIPVILGTVKVVPPYGSDPYTEIAGDDQYFRCLFVIGYGPLDITTEKIGDTLLTSFSDVESETREGYDDDAALTLATQNIDEEPLSIQLTQVGGWFQRTTVTETTEISFDVTFPNGLIQFARTVTSPSDQTEFDNSVTIQYRYSVAGAGVWTTDSFTVTARRSSTIRKNIRIGSLTSGQYDVQLQRTTADHDTTEYVDDCYWTVLRSVHGVDPILFSSTPLAKTALRIKASGQLNGMVDSFSCIATSVCLDYDESSDTWVEQATNNPASLYRYVLQHPANKKAVANARIDLDTLETWHTVCETEGWTYNQVIDFQSSVDEILKEIAAAGFASRAYTDGKHSVVIDTTKATTVQHFTPRNSWGFSSQKIFATLPHAFRVRFANANVDYREDERIVYDDGYDANNATRFEQLSLPGVTDPDLVWKQGRRHIATARLQPERYSFYTDFEHLVCTRGSLIRVSHDVPSFGVAFGRVKVVDEDSDYCYGFTTDSIVPMSESINYAVRVRLKTGTAIVAAVQRMVGNGNTIVFSSPLTTASDWPESGDMFMFGVLGSDSAELIVIAISPGADATAKITAVDYSPARLTAADGTIPAFTTNITLPSSVLTSIGAPIISNVRSNEDVLYRDSDMGLSPQILIAFLYKSGRLYDQIDRTEVQYRLSSSDGPWRTQTFPNFISEVALRNNIEEGATYDIRARYITIKGVASDWTTIEDHLVVGKSTLPPDVTELWLENNIIRWVYTSFPKDFAGFRVRHRAGTRRSWADGIDAHNDLIKGTTFSLDALPKGTRTLMVKAEDVAGNQSATAAYLIKDLGDYATENVIVEYDYATAGYPGTITNGAVDGTDLEATEEATDWWTTDDNSLFWDASGLTLLWSSIYLQMTYVFTYTPATSVLPSTMYLDYTIAGSPWSLLYLVDGTTLMWDKVDAEDFWDEDTDEFWTGNDTYSSWPGSLAASRRKFSFKIITGAGTTQGVVSELKVQIDVPDIVERFEDVVISSSGNTRLTLANTYRGIVSVVLGLQDDGGDGFTARVVDKDADLGPNIQVFGQAGALCDGTIDAVVYGY